MKALLVLLCSCCVAACGSAAGAPQSNGEAPHQSSTTTSSVEVEPTTVSSTTPPTSSEVLAVFDATETGFAEAVFFPEGHIADPMLPSAQDVPKGTEITIDYSFERAPNIEGCGSSVAHDDFLSWLKRIARFSIGSTQVSYSVGWIGPFADVDLTMQELDRYNECDLSTAEQTVVLRNLAIEAPASVRQVTAFSASSSERNIVWIGAILDHDIVVAIKVGSETAGSEQANTNAALRYLEMAASRVDRMVGLYEGCDDTWALVGQPGYADAATPFELCDGYTNWADDLRRAEYSVPPKTDSFHDRATTTTQELCWNSARTLKTATEAYTSQTGLTATDQADLIPVFISEELYGVDLDPTTGLPRAASGSDCIGVDIGY